MHVIDIKIIPEECHSLSQWSLSSAHDQVKWIPAPKGNAHSATPVPFVSWVENIRFQRLH